MNRRYFSVIVPVYHAEAYLRKCVASVLDQQFADFELILVNDGSPDGSPAICEEYAAADARVQVIHKPNGGVSSARNAGLDAANGRYILFVDSDDHFASNTLEVFHQMLEESGAPLAICGMESVDQNDRAISGYHSEIDASIAGTHQLDDVFFWRLFSARSLGSCGSKAFEAARIREANLRFDEQMTFAEDTDFVLRYLKTLERDCLIAVSNEQLYRYLTVQHGSAVQRFDESQWPAFEKIFGALEAYLSQDVYREMLSGYVHRAVRFTVNGIFAAFPDISCGDFQKLSKNIFRSGYYQTYSRGRIGTAGNLYARLLRMGSPTLVWTYRKLSCCKAKWQGR